MVLSTKKATAGFSLFETVVVIAMLSILVSLLLPSIQRLRLASRQTTSLDNLSTIGKASLVYDEINGTLPPYMGVPEDLVIFRPNSGLFLDYQNTYSLVQLLPFLGQQELADQIDPFAFESVDMTIEEAGYPSIGEWLSGSEELGLPGIEAVLFGQNIPVFRIPDDPQTLGDSAVFASYPSGSGTLFSAVVFTRDNELSLSLTNYGVNAGAIAITSRVDPTSPFAGFHGPIRLRTADSVITIPDGASNVAMFGEVLGVNSGFFGTPTTRRHSLVNGWAIGRADLYGSSEVFGDAFESSDFQFGSFHPDSVNFVRCDGSVTIVNRGVSSRQMGRFCGAADGNPFELVVLGDVDRNGKVDLFDVSPFVESLNQDELDFAADIDENGTVDIFDISPFVDLITN